MGAGVPSVSVAIYVPARGQYNVPVISPEIDARQEIYFIGDRLTRMPEEEMAATATCQAPDRLWKVVRMGLDELLEALLATMARVDIEGYDPGHIPSSKTEVAAGPLGPPLANFGFIYTRIIKAMRRVRMLPGVRTGEGPTGALALHDRVDRKDVPATTGVGERCVEHLWGYGLGVVCR